MFKKFHWEWKVLLFAIFLFVGVMYLLLKYLSITSQECGSIFVNPMNCPVGFYCHLDDPDAGGLDVPGKCRLGLGKNFR